MGFLYSQLFVTPAPPAYTFRGQTIIVTGSNVGLGKEAARHFCRLGAEKVILAVRNLAAGEAARKDIQESTRCDPNVVEVWSLDLSSYSSVKSFADRASRLPRIDVLLENAGINTAHFVLAEGHERTITVNVISTFLLALLMLPKLKAVALELSIFPRLVIEVHAITRFPEWKEPNIFAALDRQPGARMSERYPTSKLLEVLVVRALAPKLEGSGVVLNMLNPGLCRSQLGREGHILLSILTPLLARTTEVGSRTLVAAAQMGEESHGKYMTDGTVDDGALSSWVKSEDGKKVSEQVWKELSEILESVHPGITDSL
jgi:NAD(P)-dependent dehydrogenase (short-subunit alcohol dehydrogenase family)